LHIPCLPAIGSTPPSAESLCKRGASPCGPALRALSSSGWALLLMCQLFRSACPAQRQTNYNEPQSLGAEWPGWEGPGGGGSGLSPL
jgi:hypothetical protein